jgi:hypothetical protein
MAFLKQNLAFGYFAKAYFALNKFSVSVRDIFK